MSRYIDADALKKKKVYCAERHENVVSVAEIDWQPTADVIEVVRCKDCIYSFMSISGKKVLYCDMHPSDDHLDLDKDYFCSYGERRAEG